MKRYNLFVAVMLISICSLSSCVKHPDSVVPDSTLDLSFKFNTRKNITVSVSAVNEMGYLSPGVLFSIYLVDPYTSEGVFDASVSPIYQGYTEKTGSVSVTLPIPNSTDNLYIVPMWAGYGLTVSADTENSNVSVELKGVQFSSGTKSVTKSDENPIERDRVNCGRNYKFYCSYQEGVDYSPEYGVLNPESELVSEELISNEIKELTESWFVESVNYYDMSVNPDIVVENDGTKVWLTYIGDGGYSTGNLKNGLNSVMYYTYREESELPDFSKNADNAMRNSSWDLSYAFFNINCNYIACGTKVQLLYWNGEKYIEEFPAGIKIGFAFLKLGYGTVPNRIGCSLNTGDFKPSTPCITSAKESYAAIIRSEEYDCYFMGMENAGVVGERDCNEAVMMIQTSKPVSQIQSQSAPGTVTEVSTTYEGTLAFEDLWPYEGDYDFNDFVTDYKYSLYKVRGTNNIAYMKLIYTPKALGATKDNGFGLELPFPTSSVTVEGASVENDCENITLTVIPNTRAAFGNVAGAINTFSHVDHINSTPDTVKITFASPIPESSIPYSSFNPYIFSVENRGKEVHLVDYAPTEKADITLLATGVDKSYPQDGVYFRMDNKFPWALDIASTGLYTWRYPVEMAKINEVYLHYSDWVNDHDTSWFDWTKEGNAVTEKLY